MSASASRAVFAVLLLRLVLRKAPKWISVLLWGIAALRLAVPFSLKSRLSIIPPASAVPATFTAPEALSLSSPPAESIIPAAITGPSAFDPSYSAGPVQIILPVLSAIWIVGVAAAILYAVISCIKIKRNTAEAVLLRDNIFVSSKICAPFLFGIIRPRIYIPPEVSERELRLIAAHENAHISRGDHIIKPLGFLLLSFHWFNPLVWIGYAMFCRDIESACDEKAIKKMDKTSRADYAQALLSFGSKTIRPQVCPLAFGEENVKSRIKSVLKYKKPAFLTVCAAVVICIAAAVCILTDPKVYISLKEAEGWSIDEASEPVRAYVSSGEEGREILSAGEIDGKTLRELSELRIYAEESKEPDLSDIRSLTLQSAEDGKETTVTFISGFKSVFVSNSPAPSRIYRLEDSDKARELYETVASRAESSAEE